MTRIAPQKAFDILGVSPQDDFATIRRAWIRLVKENHPDVAGGDLCELTARLAEINESYDSLRWHSPEKVRIRKEQEERADRRSASERRASPGRRSGTERRTASQDWTGPERRSAQQPRRTETERRDQVSRRDGTDRRLTAEDAVATGVTSWTAMRAIERFRAVQDLCAPTATGPLKARRITV